MRTQRPSRSPSRRMGLAPTSRSLSSTSSTIAPTWRSVAAETMTKTSVRASCSLTSMPVIVVASLSSAARAATLARSRARSVAGTALLRSVRGGGWRTGGIQAVFVDVLHDAVWDEVPDGLGALDACPAVGGADRHGRHLLEGDAVRGQSLVGQFVPWPGDPDEVGEKGLPANGVTLQEVPAMAISST